MTNSTSRLKVCSLNSGSNGNAYYIGNETMGILIDLGISARMTTNRLAEIGVKPEQIAAIIVSHEHADHIRGIKTFQKRFHTKVYTNPKTHSKFRHPIHNLAFFEEEDFKIGPFTISPFKKYHDAADPYSFIVQYQDYNIGVMTDIGRVCDSLKSATEKCQVLFLESNYDEEMLDNGPYPIFLKDRIRGGEGHLSNMEAKDLLMDHRHPALEKVFLSHISENNNHPDICLQTFNGDEFEGVNFEIAPRNGISSVWTGA